MTIMLKWLHVCSYGVMVDGVLDRYGSRVVDFAWLFWQSRMLVAYHESNGHIVAVLTFGLGYLKPPGAIWDFLIKETEDEELMQSLSVFLP